MYVYECVCVCIYIDIDIDMAEWFHYKVMLTLVLFVY